MRNGHVWFVLGAAAALSITGQARGQVESPDPTGVPEGTLTPAAQDQVLAAQGDLNADGVVGPDDLTILLGLITQVQENPLLFPSQGDLDSDGLVTEWDVQVLLSNFGNPADRDSQDVINQLLQAGVLAVQPRQPGIHLDSVSREYPPGNPAARPPNVPPSHRIDISNGYTEHVTKTSALPNTTPHWPANHPQAASSTWPAPQLHISSVSSGWNPGHVATTSGMKTLPIDSYQLPHHIVISNTRPPIHKATTSMQWPPNHEYLLSLTWTPGVHDTTTSKKWRPGHHIITSNTTSGLVVPDPQPAGPGSGGAGGPIVIDIFPVGGDGAGL